MTKSIANYALAIALAGGIALPAAAQDAGDGYAKIAATRTKLVDKGEVFVNGVQDPEAAYETRETFHGTLTGGYFVIDTLAVEASISTPATTNNIPAGSLAGTPNLGDDEFVLLTLGGTFAPLDGPVSPYIGGGIQVQVTTQERDGLAVGLNIPNAHGPYVKAGLDYKVSPNWGLFAEVRKAWYSTNASGQLPLDASYTVFADVTANAELDPFSIQLGAFAFFGGEDETGAPAARPWLAEDDSDWMVRAGASALRLRDSMSLDVGGAAFPGAGVSTFEHNTVSVQIGRRLTRNLAVNATLGIPPKVEIFGAGSIGALPKLGEVRYGPTALTLQYHPLSSGRFRPYIGAGIAYMYVFGTKDGAFENLEVDNDFGPAFEIGTDIMIGRNWGLFADVKKALLRPDASGSFAGNAVEGKTKLDPLVFSMGASFRF